MANLNSVFMQRILANMPKVVFLSPHKARKKSILPSWQLDEGKCP